MNHREDYLYNVVYSSLNRLILMKGMLAVVTMMSGDADGDDFSG